jgi:glycosyltransferase involved in cell wall biosynthesis
MSTRADALRVRDGGQSPPRVTVFIPTYNRARWLSESIEGALAQTYGDFVLVVSDNASTDGTQEVAASFDDPRVVYRRLDEHVGLNEHFNLCYGSADTEYMFLIPDDDRMSPDALEQTIPVLDANPRAALVHGCADLVDQDGTEIAVGHNMTGLTASVVEAGNVFIRRAIDRGYTVHASTALIRATALADTRLRDEDYPVTDVGLWLRVALSWDIAFLARTLALVRIHDGAYTAGGRGVTEGGYVQQVEVIEKLREVKLRFLEENQQRFPEGGDLAHAARRAMRRDLLDLAGHMTIPERKVARTARTLGALAVRDPGIVREPRAWRLLGASILGHRAAERIKRRRAVNTSGPAVSPQ